jgi:hypothetical protein
MRVGLDVTSTRATLATGLAVTRTIITAIAAHYSKRRRDRVANDFHHGFHFLYLPFSNHSGLPDLLAYPFVVTEPSLSCISNLGWYMFFYCVEDLAPHVNRSIDLADAMSHRRCKLTDAVNWCPSERSHLLYSNKRCLS